MLDKIRTGFWETKSEGAVLNHNGETQSVEEAVPTNVGPGGQSFEENTAGGLGRHLGLTSCTLLIVGRIIGTGIFSTPYSILSTVGSVGAALMLWVLGFLLSFCGLFIWLEFGTMFPRSGGEKVYLEAVYRRPKYLATVIFAANAILFGFTGTGCLVFATNILVAATPAENPVGGPWAERGIALALLAFVTLLQALAPRVGVYLMNFLTVIKIGILIFIVVTGWAVLSGTAHVCPSAANWGNAFAHSSINSSDYATATLQVLYAYYGWSNVNYVLNNVRNPVRTLKIAGPLGLGICALLYVLANIAYFSALTQLSGDNDSLVGAAQFFACVFNHPSAGRVLSVFVALSALGNVITVMFAAARVNQELAKEGIPLPFGNRFWASNWPTGKAPLGGFIIYLIPGVIVILAMSPENAYFFILELDIYGNQIINFFIVVGLLWMRWKRPELPRPVKVWLPLAVFYLVASVFLIVVPFLRPTGASGGQYPKPYYLFPLVAIGVLLFGVCYWAAWRIVLPKVFGYELIPRKEVLEDGTVVTLFSRKKVE